MQPFTFEDDKPKGVPPGAYRADFVGYKETTTKSGDALLWQWKVTSGPESGKVASCFTDPPTVTKPSPSNALGRVLAGLAGKQFSGGDSFDPASVVGKPYTVMVGAGPKGGGICVRTVMPVM